MYVLYKGGPTFISLVKEKNRWISVRKTKCPKQTCLDKTFTTRSMSLLGYKVYKCDEIKPTGSIGIKVQKMLVLDLSAIRSLVKGDSPSSKTVGSMPTGTKTIN